MDTTYITIFSFDKKTQTYSKKEYLGDFQATISSSFNQGYTKANSVSAWLFYSKNPNLEITFFHIGDLIVKGKHEDITRETELKNYYKIQTIINNDYGSYSMQHIQIGAN